MLVVLLVEEANSHLLRSLGELGADMQEGVMRWSAILGGGLMILIGVWDLVQGRAEMWIPRSEIAFGVGLWMLLAIAQARNDAITHLPGALLKVQDRFADLEAVRKEHYKMRNSMDSQLKQVEVACHQLLDYQSKLQSVVNLVESLQSKQVQFDENNISLRQRIGEAGRRDQLWLERCTEFLDYLERSVSHQGLADTAAKELQKTLNEYERCLLPLGFQVVAPVSGERFDGTVMQAVGDKLSDVVEAGNVVHCEQWGLRINGKIARHAKVVLSRSVPKDGVQPDNHSHTNLENQAIPASDIAKEGEVGNADSDSPDVERPNSQTA